MVKRRGQTIEVPPVELFRASSCFWFLNDAVACGLLSEYHSCQSWPRYWKWNRRLGNCRITSVIRDKKLLSGASEISGSGTKPVSFLSHKPESRMAWREEAGGRVLFCKAYRQTNFPRSAEGAAWLKNIPAAPRLHAIDVDRRVIRWEWIEGNPPPATAAVDMPLGLIEPLHGFKYPIESYLPRLTPDKLRRHMEERLEAFRAWLPVLLPSKTDALPLLEEDLSTLDRRLAELATPRRLHLIHGDLRRRNVLIDSGGNPVLLDSDHVAVGEREWDLAAWVAESGLCDEDLGREQLETLSTKGRLDAGRLRLYSKAWRLLIALKSIEENSG